MTLRLPDDEYVYRKAIQSGSLRKLYEEKPTKEFTYWVIVANRFPHTRVTVQNDMLVLKREAALDDITRQEWKEYIEILLGLKGQYHTVTYNLPGTSSIPSIPHWHLYRWKPEFI